MQSPGALGAEDGHPEGGRRRVDRGWSAALRAGVLSAAALGAALLIASEFLTLYRVATTNGGHPISSTSTGSHDAYALILIALVAVALAYGAAFKGSRVALLALGALGLATLLIALLGDWPDAHATGMVGTAATQYQQGSAKPQAGLYIETLGAIMLIISSGCGILLGSPAGGGEPAGGGDRTRPAASSAP